MSKTTIIHFGYGNLVVDTGKYEGRHAVFIAPAKIGGEIGKSAKQENQPLDSLVDGEIVLTFPNEPQAKRVAYNLITTFFGCKNPPGE